MQDSNLLIQISRNELTQLIADAVRTAMPENVIQATPQQPIKGIHQLAKFLNVSPARAQKLKNENAFPYFQDGRTLLFDPDMVRQSMSKTNTR